MLFDLIGALFSFTSTYYFIRLNNKAWPVGIFATILNGWLYWHQGIYADVGLEFFYFLSMCYGWRKWQIQNSQKIINKQNSLNSLKFNQWVILCLFFLLGFIIIYYLLTVLTSSTIPLRDAVTTSLSLVAQFLMCHKVIATWIAWFFADALYASMYFAKNLPIHGVLMIIYAVMAIAGYLIWAKQNSN